MTHIQLSDIRKSFLVDGNPVEVLKGISLSIAKGEIYGIIGRSGAGKSTLVRCINLLERPTSGTVVVGEQDLTALPDAALRKARQAIGMVFQHFNLLSSRTVADNIALPLEVAGWSRSAIRTTVAPLLDLVGLADKADLYPAQLSGGQKQRVGIARSLASKPSVLLCDEATSALDPETTQSILALLRDINRTLGLTVVLITHEMQVVRDIAHRVAVLEDGRLVEEGRTFDVLAQPQAEVTRRFVSDLLAHDLPDAVARRLSPEPKPGGRPVLRVVFKGAAANEPVLDTLIRTLGLRLNILHGRIDYIQGEPFGVLVVEILENAHRLPDALAHLHGLELTGEILGHVFPDDRAAA